MKLSEVLDIVSKAYVQLEEAQADLKSAQDRVDAAFCALEDIPSELEDVELPEAE